MKRPSDTTSREENGRGIGRRGREEEGMQSGEGRGEIFDERYSILELSEGFHYSNRGVMTTEGQFRSHLSVSISVVYVHPLPRLPLILQDSLVDSLDGLRRHSIVRESHGHPNVVCEGRESVCGRESTLLVSHALSPSGLTSGRAKASSGFLNVESGGTLTARKAK